MKLGDRNFLRRSLPNLFFATLLLFVAGCMGSPQNDQLVQASDPIAFSGFIPGGDQGQAPQGEVVVTSGSSTIASFPVSQSNPRTDSAGKNWYSWGGNKIIPYTYWSQVPGQSQLSIQLQASFGSAPLSTFDWVPPSNPPCEEAMKTGDSIQIVTLCRDYVSPAGYPAPTAQCNEAKAGGNLTQIIMTCKSSESPTVTLISKCGGYKESCCKSSNPCAGAYECAEVSYDPNSPPNGEYDHVVGRDYNPNTHAPEGQEKATLCLARMPDNSLM
jgi:hypothetical protein